MTFAFHPEAEAEFNKAIDYYEETEPGLGFDFAIEVHSAIQRSVAFPKHGPSLMVKSGVLWYDDFHSEFCTQ